MHSREWSRCRSPFINSVSMYCCFAFFCSDPFRVFGADNWAREGTSLTGNVRTAEQCEINIKWRGWARRSKDSVESGGRCLFFRSYTAGASVRKGKLQWGDGLPYRIGKYSCQLCTSFKGCRTIVIPFSLSQVFLDRRFWLSGSDMSAGNAFSYKQGTNDGLHGFKP